MKQFERRIEAGDMPPGSRFPTEKAITRQLSASAAASYGKPLARLAAGAACSRSGVDSGAYVAEARAPAAGAFEVRRRKWAASRTSSSVLEMRMALETEIAPASPADHRCWRRTASRDAPVAPGVHGASTISTAVAADSAFSPRDRRRRLATTSHRQLQRGFRIGITHGAAAAAFLRDRVDTEHRALLRGRSRRARIDPARHHRAGYAARDRLAARRHMKKSLRRHRTGPGH